MNAMTSIAKKRHDELVKSIARREDEIGKLRDELEKLEVFCHLANELFPTDVPNVKSDSSGAEPESERRSREPVAMVRPVMPVRQPQSA